MANEQRILQALLAETPRRLAEEKRVAQVNAEAERVRLALILEQEQAEIARKN